MDLSKEVVVITGGSSGIGKSTAIEFAKKGASVIIIGRTKSKLIDVLDQLKKYNEKCSCIVCDVKDKNKINSTIKLILEKYGRINILVNNAGIAIYNEFSDLKDEEIHEIFDTNFFSIVYFCKYAIPIMKNQSYGHIINVSSVVSKISSPNLAIYSASKSAVYAFSESLYYELKKYGIKVTVVCPGATKTNLFNNKSWEKFPAEKRHKNAMPPEKVAKEIINSVKKYKFEVIVPKSFNFKIKALHLFRNSIMKKIEKLPR